VFCFQHHGNLLVYEGNKKVLVTFHEMFGLCVAGNARGGNEMIFTAGYQGTCGIHLLGLTKSDIYQ